MQFRLREQAVLKLAQQLSTGPPDALIGNWQCPPTLLFLNKQDKLPDNTRAIALQQIKQQLSKNAVFKDVFEGAAMLGVGVDELKRYLVRKVSTCMLVIGTGSHAGQCASPADTILHDKISPPARFKEHGDPMTSMLDDRVYRTGSSWTCTFTPTRQLSTARHSIYDIVICCCIAAVHQ